MKNLIIILFGATGNLARTKLIPALYNMVAEKKLENFFLVGAAKDESSPQQLLAQAQPFITNPDAQIIQTLLEKTRYHKTEFTQKSDFVSLEKFVSSLEKKHGFEGNRLLYLATPPEFFCQVTDFSAQTGVMKKIPSSSISAKGIPRTTSDKSHHAICHKIVYEKPFGRDFASAHEINTCVKKYFDESQVYRVDHYLTKEIVSNIAMIRFSNCVFEPLWNNRFVDSIQIILSEDLCVQERGRYYDRYGALRDVVQNHILELLALIGMEAPDSLVGDAVRQKRVDVLKNIKLVDGILGQYEGYTKETGVQPDSKTETFASLLLHVENERWSGVPFFIKTGKCLDKKETVIYIKFKQVDCLLTKGCPMDSNFLKIQIDPISTFALSLNAKKPGTLDELFPVQMEFCHSCEFLALTPQEYEVILQEVIRGDTAISVRFDEIEEAWKLIDLAYGKKFPLYFYKKGSDGPDEVKAFAKKHGEKWLS